jgi:hypothetical protein
MRPLHEVVETPTYLADAADAKMTEEDRARTIDIVARNPRGGDPLGSNLFKVRIARPGRGKSKGWRVLVAYVADDEPVYLMAVFSKGDKANLTKKEVEALRAAINEGLER